MTHIDQLQDEMERVRQLPFPGKDRCNFCGGDLEGSQIWQSHNFYDVTQVVRLEIFINPSLGPPADRCADVKCAKKARERRIAINRFAINNPAMFGLDSDESEFLKTSTFQLMEELSSARSKPRRPHQYLV